MQIFKFAYSALPLPVLFLVQVMAWSNLTVVTLDMFFSVHFYSFRFVSFRFAKYSKPFCFLRLHCGLSSTA